jgi:hypothetical protein
MGCSFSLTVSAKKSTGDSYFNLFERSSQLIYFELLIVFYLIL